jgi:hypothetical protein
LFRNSRVWVVVRCAFLCRDGCGVPLVSERRDLDPRFVDAMRAGADLAKGSRFLGEEQRLTRTAANAKGYR